VRAVAERWRGKHQSPHCSCLPSQEGTARVEVLVTSQGLCPDLELYLWGPLLYSFAGWSQANSGLLLTELYP
jgi:hypothetical protein